jgi:DNA end-binding protein Ku
MPQMIWRGAISFGLVHIPVRLYPAISPQRVGFDLLDRRSMDRIGYRKINKRSGKEVEKKDIVRGIEYEKDRYVALSDAEISSAHPESTQTIDILAFVEAPEISFLYLDTPYFLAPDRGGDKVYALLRDALRQSGRIGIANVVLHSKQHLASLTPLATGLSLNTLHWSDEIRELEPLHLPAQGAAKTGVSARELKMALQLIEDMTEPWDPRQYHDTFHDEIMKLVARKVKQGKLSAPRGPGHANGDASDSSAPRSADILDLTEVLKRSLAGRPNAAGAPRGATKTAGAARKPAAKAKARSATTGAATKRAPRKSAAPPKRARAGHA